MGGFVGAHLAARLHNDGWEVAGTVRPGGRHHPHAGRDQPHPARLHGIDVEAIPADLADRDATQHAVRTADADVVFLLAVHRGHATPAERATAVAVNATSVAWTLQAVTPRCTAVIRLGSSTEYAPTDVPMDEATPVRPGTFYGATKAAGSAILLTRPAPAPARTAVLRAFQVYGPADHPHRLVPTVLRAARDHATLPLAGPGLRRDWVYVDDVVEACVRTATTADLPAQLVLNIGTGCQTANEELVEIARQVTGRPITVAIGGHPPRQWDTGTWAADPRQARTLLGWEPRVPLDEGLRRCWNADPEWSSLSSPPSTGTRRPSPPSPAASTPHSATDRGGSGS